MFRILLTIQLTKFEQVQRVCRQTSGVFEIAFSQKYCIDGLCRVVDTDSNRYFRKIYGKYSIN